MGALPLPLAAATEVAGIVTDLAIVLFAAKLGDELFKRLGQPALIGEILAGLLVGPSVLGLIEPSETLEVFAELGVVFLLFWVGLETRISDMKEVGGTAAVVGVSGVALPFAAGTGAALIFGESTETSLFIGAALAATSVGITSAVFAELGMLATRAARTVLGAAVIDDILALLLVAVAVGIAAEGGVDVTSIAVAALLAAGFVAVFALGGTALMRRAPQLLHAPRFSESPLLPAVILCLGIAALAAEIGLAAVIGAFLAGMIVAETKEQHPIEDEVAPLYAFFPPFFFASIGIDLDLDVLLEPETLLAVAGLSALAAVSKLAGAWPAARRLGRREGAIIAVAMIPRGEVGIIVAGIGAASGVIDTELFATIVGMSIVTTLIVPPLLRHLSREPEAEPAAGPAGDPSPPWQ
jgi:Kef-type K+ transport system membrane component KefB